MNFKSENNLLNKKGLSKAVIILITSITAIVILVAGIGLLTTIEQLKSENVKLMNENVELTEKLSETRLKLKKTSDDLATAKISLTSAKYKLEEATFELGEDMLTLPEPSRKFDCDDSSLYMYLYFTNLGYDVRIVAGNLDLDNETFYQCDHVWIWANDGITGDLAYDWGKFCGYFNYNEPHEQQQHYYGYVLSYRDLLRDALRDQ